MISLYRLPDFVMGPMANPFYHDLGLSKDVVGGVRGTVGLAFSLVGITLGGLSAVRFGYMTTLILGAILQGAAVASFALLAHAGPDLRLFSAVMAMDSVGISFAGVALVTYMASLTSLGYTATQSAPNAVVVRLACEPVTGLGFVYAPMPIVVRQTTTFTATYTSGVPAPTFAWSVDGGAATAGPSLAYTFTTTGTHTVALTATNTCGAVPYTAPVNVEPRRIYLPMIRRQ